MRDVLFRGKSKEGKSEWIYGDLTGSGTQFPAIDQPGANDEILVRASTVGQYIGLHDINGVKIFEGDIVKIKSDRFKDSQGRRHAIKGMVYFRDASFCVEAHGGCMKHYAWQDYEVEILGNVWDNPEMETYEVQP